MKTIFTILMLSLLASLLSACGDDNAFSAAPETGELRIGSGTGGGFTEGGIGLSPASIVVGASTSVSVNIVDSTGALVSNVDGTVAFSSTCVSQSLSSFSTASTNIASGTATTTYTDISCTGPDTITATATLSDGTTLTANASLTISEVVRLGSGSGTGFQEGIATLGSSSINTGETTTIAVNIVDRNNALSTNVSTVTFSSVCASNSQANFTTPSVVTSSGTAITTYIDQGCVGNDFITATLTSGGLNLTATANLAIAPLRIGAGTGAGFVNNAITLGLSTITEGNSTTVSVNIVDSNAVLVSSPSTVSFSSSCATATPSTASFTNPTVVTSTGVASTIYQDAGCPTADTITATLNTVSSFDPIATQLINIAPLRIGSGSDNNFNNGVVTLGLASISSGGTTSVSASVVDAASALITTPITVSFESNCVSQGSSSFDNNSSSTVNGIASVTYTAGASCSGTDNIRAKINPFNNNGRTAQANLTIGAPSVGSIQFTSTSSDVIALQGTGNSSTLNENATLTFTVFDSTGSPLSNALIDFALNTTVGGITLQAANDTSDSLGRVQAIVQSGTVSTSVRVTATVNSTNFSTQSAAIVISTGLPHQNSFSLSASQLNPRAWDQDNVTVTITALLADRFNNPIQDGTNISFTTELGSIVSSCTTINGGCSTTWRSQAPRSTIGPGSNAGRTTILANVVGEESFIDGDGNGIYSDGDTSGFSDLPEAFVDWDEDGNRDNGTNIPSAAFNGTPEPFKDFNVNGTYDGPDAKFNGVSCTHSTDCSTTQTTFVRSAIVLVLAEDNPAIVKVGGATTPATTPNCDSTGGTSPCAGTGSTYPTEIDVSASQKTISFTIVGATNFQVLPVGTTIAFSAGNGKIVSGASQTVVNTSANTYPNGSPDNLGVATYSVTVAKDTISSTDGSLTIKVTTPGGLITEFLAIPIRD